MPTIPTKPSRARNRPSSATASTVITIPFVRRPATVPALLRRPHADTLDAFLAPVRGDVPAARAGRHRRARNFVARARSRNFVAPSWYRSFVAGLASLLVLCRTHARQPWRACPQARREVAGPWMLIRKILDSA